ncbi:MAG TPA: biotin/lipoyl-containing protein, partial [Candidatus Dormibacteraeota bacterium]
MALTVTMPQLGESVTEGTIAKWLKQPGDAIAKYESIAEVITDKVNAEIPAPADGVMAELIAQEGAVVPVGQPICSIETADAASASASPAPAATGAASATAQVEPAAQATPPAMSPTQPAQPALPDAAASQAEPAQPIPAASEPLAGEVVGAVAESQPQAQTQSPPSTGSASGNGAAGYHLTPAVR